MNAKTVAKAMEKHDIRQMARLALSAKADMSEEREHIIYLVGMAYLAATKGEEPDSQRLQEYLRMCVFAEHMQEGDLEVDG